MEHRVEQDNSTEIPGTAAHYRDSRLIWKEGDARYDVIRSLHGTRAYDAVLELLAGMQDIEIEHLADTIRSNVSGEDPQHVVGKIDMITEIVGKLHEIMTINEQQAEETDEEEG